MSEQVPMSQHRRAIVRVVEFLWVTATKPL
jgi:hypothetical protein